MITQNWKQLSSIQVGGVICLPVIVVGQALAKTYGLASALLAIVFGNVVLLALSIVAALMSHNRKLNTIENASASFGSRGAVFFACVLALSLLCWYGIQLNLMGIALLDLLGLHAAGLNYVGANVALGIMMTYVSLYGLTALNRLSDLSLPVLIATLIYALLLPADKPSSYDASQLEFSGISMVVATAIAAIIDLPTYFRHARSREDAVVSALIVFGVAIPAIELVGVYLGAVREGDSVIDLLKGSHPLWNSWVALFVLLAGWTTNNTNLYSAAVGLEFIKPGTTYRSRAWFVGLAGTALACCNLLDNLELLLELLGIGIGSMGAVVLLCYLLKAREAQVEALGAWAAGIVLGILSLSGLLTITSIPVLDAFVGAVLGALTLYLTQRNSYAENSSI